MHKNSARQQIDAEEFSVKYVSKVMRLLFSKNNNCAPSSDLLEVVEELHHFGICTKKELRLFLKKHRKQLLIIDKERLDKMHQEIYRQELGDIEYLDCVRRQYWFCYPALVRTAMEIEFGDDYDTFASQRDRT